MSEDLGLPDSECALAQSLLAQFVDADLAAEQAAWLGTHLEACAQCREELAALARIDGELTGWGLQLGERNPPPAAAREQLSARMESADRRMALFWMPVAAGAIAAALVVATAVTHKQPPAERGGVAAFIEIPFVPPLDPRESTTIVRMNVRVGTLIAAGYRVSADPDAMVPADVLVGEDGRAHAVRVLSDIEWNGTGD